MLETEVVSSSLQSMVIRKFRDREEGVQGVETYKQALTDALQQKPPDNVVKRNNNQEPDNQYPLGTLAQLNYSIDEMYLLVALTETELQGYIPPDNCDATKLWTTLDKMWTQIAKSGLLRGNDINVPLIGGGVSGIRLSPNQLLAINILVLLNAIIENGVMTTGEIRIVLYWGYMTKIDLSDFKKKWLT